MVGVSTFGGCNFRCLRESVTSSSIPTGDKGASLANIWGMNIFGRSAKC